MKYEKNNEFKKQRKKIVKEKLHFFLNKKQKAIVTEYVLIDYQRREKCP